MTRDAVITQLMEHPDARDAWVVLSDLLQQEGNPRGEWLALELALRHAPTEELKAQHRAFFDAHAPALLGELLSQVIREGYGEATWSYGYVETLSYVGSNLLSHQRAVKWLITAICTQPEALTFLRTLKLARTDLDDPRPLACFRGLRELDVSRTAVKSLDWVGAFPALRRVDVSGCALPKGALKEAMALNPRVTFASSKS
ncbi:MAG: hypothetical protein U0228_09095 [Myxococcaceae bacterium]